MIVFYQKHQTLVVIKSNNPPSRGPTALFCSNPTPIFESKFSWKFQTTLIKNKTSFHNRKLTSVGIVFCLNKTVFHFIRKNSVNKFYISIANCHTVNVMKLKVSGLNSSLFHKIFANFPQKFGGGNSRSYFPSRGLLSL